MPSNEVYIIRAWADDYHLPGEPATYYLAKEAAEADAEKLNREQLVDGAGHVIEYYVSSLQENKQVG